MTLFRGDDYHLPDAALLLLCCELDGEDRSVPGPEVQAETSGPQASLDDNWLLDYVANHLAAVDRYLMSGRGVRLGQSERAQRVRRGREE